MGPFAVSLTPARGATTVHGGAVAIAAGTLTVAGPIGMTGGSVDSTPTGRLYVGGDVTATSSALGSATISAAFLRTRPSDERVEIYFFVQAVPSVTVMVVPPGWVEGAQPLDPSLGQWSATMSADASMASTRPRGTSVTMSALGLPTQ